MTDTATERCGAIPQGMTDEACCTLPSYHNSPHEALDGTVKWEPLYVADLRRSVTELQGAIRQAVALLETPAPEWDRDDRNMLMWLRGLRSC